MEDSLPAAALGHFVMKVQNIEASRQFYAGLGLRALETFPGLAIIELRGGTHLLLFQKDDDQSSTLQNSHAGQRPERKTGSDDCWAYKSGAGTLQDRPD